MIWRGLQKSLGRSVILAVIALGAAPCFAVLPSNITLGGFGRLFYSGNYFVVDGKYNYKTNTIDMVSYTNSVGVVELQMNEANNILGTFRRVLHVPSSARVAISSSGVVTEWTTNVFVEFNPSNWYWVSSDGQYGGNYSAERAAYDKESFSWAQGLIYIPLGFSLGMAFWSVALCAGIGMKWARDLASAAS